MDPKRYEHVREIYHQVCDEPSEQRDRLLADACGDDAELRREVETLLEIETRPGGFLEQPPDPGALPAGLPASIGRYRILRAVGEGGMGVVYEAEQEQPVRRRVALKIIRLGMDTKQVIGRFEAERQALAMMDHPNIAKVLDAGATETGRPYFVMELVRGEPITAYCDRHNLSIRARLALMEQVCLAVQHAHQKGIIHRDIKPTNVMVALQDGAPVPKVIDFGIAKATNARLTEKTVFTEFRQLIGTPEYMSPEQAEMGGLDIDTRSDVYSLGVLLYELLTGTTPFDGETLRSAGYGEIQRIIREVTPPRPSTRLSTSAAVASVAKHRQTEPRRLGLTIRGDLDWIVMKAMEKDRTRRYETASALAADIQRHMNDEPVVASPPSTAYRVRKFARRNARAVAAATAVFLALVAGVIVSAAFAVNAARARNDAQAQEVIADAERDAAQASLDFMIELFEIPDPGESRGNAITAREILDRGVEQIEGAFVGRPRVRGRLLHTMGLVYVNLGLFEEAIPMLERAVEAWREAAAEDHPDLASSLFRLGEAHHYDRAYGTAEQLYRESLEMRRRLYGQDHPDVAWCLDLLSRALRDQNRLDDARRLAGEGLAMRERLLEPGHADLSESHQTLGMLASYEGRSEDAERHLRRALEIRRAALGDDNAELPELLHALGQISNQLGNRTQAIDDLRLGLEMSRRIFGLRHQNVGHTLFALGIVLNDDGQLDEAERHYTESLGILREVYGDRSVPVGTVIDTIGTLLHERQDLPGAEAKFREAIDLWQELGASTDVQRANALKNLGANLRLQERYEESERALLESRGIYARVMGEDSPRTLRLIDYLVPLYESWGKPDEAAAWRARRP